MPALRAGSLLVGDGRVLTSPVAVVVRDGLIAEVLPDGVAPNGCPVIDLGDATLMPGFVDTHAHLSMPADGRGYQAVHQLPDADLVDFGLDNARRHLACGVTTVRDNGARGTVGFELRSALAGAPSAPRILAAGRPITPPGGHFHFCGGTAASPSEIRDAVHRLADEGADHIKIMASGGGTAGSRPERSTYDVEHLRAAVTTARRRGLAVVAHCRGAESARRAVDAEVDGVEHLDFLTPDPPGPPTVRYDPETARRLRASGTWIGMTMQAGGYDTLLELRARTHSDADSGTDSVNLTRLEAYIAAKLGVLRRLLDDGLAEQIVIGTDAGPADTRFGRFSLGLALAAETGWSPPEILRAVTARAAAACRLDRKLGLVAPGYAADLVAVDPGVLTDPGRAALVRFVMVRGELPATTGRSPATPPGG